MPSNYPIAEPGFITNNNFNGNISNYVLKNLNDTLENTINILNRNSKEITFNYENLPYQINNIDYENIKDLTEKLINAINKNLPQNQKIFLGLKDMLEYKIIYQIKKDFSIICSYKFNVTNNYKEDLNNKIKDNNLVIKVSIISTIKDNTKVFILKN